MRFNFKKIAAIGASALLTGMSMGVAAAANYPSPFSTSDATAVVYGSGAGVASTDITQANAIKDDLLGDDSDDPVVVDGESFQIRRDPASEFILGTNANAIRDTLRKAHLPELLADGVFLDDNNQRFTYTQKIVPSTNLALTHFRHSELDNIPTIGIALTSSGTRVLDYYLELQGTKPDFTKTALETTTIEFLGTEYFISNVGSNSLTLLDSATTSVLDQGDTTTLNVDGDSYDVRIQAIDGTNGVIFVVNGETTNRLGIGATYKLSSGAYIGVKDFQRAQFEGDVAFAEFSIGKGKLEFTQGSEVKINEKTVTGLSVVAASMNVSDEFVGFQLRWNTDDREFVTPDKELVMPGLEAIKISMTEFYTPSEEKIEVENSGSFIEIALPLKSGDVTLPLLYHNESTAEIKGIGESEDKLLVTSNQHYLTFNKTANHEWFVASWVSATEAYSEVFRVSSVNAENETSISALGSGEDYTVANGSTFTAGDIELNIEVLQRSSSSEFVLNITNIGDTSTPLRRIYTADGMRIHLPFDVGAVNGNTTRTKGDFSVSYTANSSESVGHNNESWYLYMDEQNRVGTIGSGGVLRLTLAPRPITDATIHVSGVGMATAGAPTVFTNRMLRSQSTDDYIGYVVSELATRVDWDRSGDESTATVSYHGDESYGKVFVSAGDTVVSSVTRGTADDVVVVADSEIADVEDRDLIVVGGSCINSVAAELVGANYCTSDWESATGVGSGQFLIQSYDNPYTTGKIALLVAGYEATDTVNAATYLRTQTVDTAVGKKYVGTSATSATLSVDEDDQ